jgi:hypothetical protein
MKMMLRLHRTIDRLYRYDSHKWYLGEKTLIFQILLIVSEVSWDIDANLISNKSSFIT